MVKLHGRDHKNEGEGPNLRWEIELAYRSSIKRNSVYLHTHVFYLLCSERHWIHGRSPLFPFWCGALWMMSSPLLVMLWTPIISSGLSQTSVTGQEQRLSDLLFDLYTWGAITARSFTCGLILNLNITLQGRNECNIDSPTSCYVIFLLK